MTETITLTFGDCGENHRGMEMIGEQAEAGISVSMLEDLAECLREGQNPGPHIQEEIELINLGGNDLPEAKLLIIRNGVTQFIGRSPDSLFAEQRSFEWDTKAFMYGRVVNKHARHNVCFNHLDQEPDYENKKGRVISFEHAPLMTELKEAIEALIGVENLIVEGNRYYDVSKCGIGYHGDTERRIVVGCRLGASMPLHYQWYLDNKPIGENIEITLNHGDIYLMSEKAVGFDWKRKVIPTLRHAAGSVKFTKL